MMSRSTILRVGLGVFLVLLLAAIAPTASAQEPAPPTGTYSITYYNYIDEGGASCPSAGAIPDGTEANINHFWPENTSPYPGVGVNNYMICWQGTLNFSVAGNWTVHTINDDGMDVYTDGQITMNGWYDQGPSLHDGTINLSAGAHQVIVKYYNRTLGGTACVAWGLEGNPIPWWQCPNQASQQTAAPPVPQPYPLPQQIPLGFFPLPCFWCAQPPPVNQVPPVKVCFYRVQWGDTLSSIAWRYHTTWWVLAQANGITNPNFIYAGMILRIPNCY